MRDPTRRFSDRVDNYVKYRPSYPAGLVELLTQCCGLAPGSIIADIGSGTGKLSELLLANGNQVIGVEPNREMREAGERLLAGHERFVSVDGTAEATTLPERSVDLITAGQAFHWFDKQRARQELARILRPGGWVALIWNIRRVEESPFARAYEQFLRTHGTDYGEISKDDHGDEISAFFAPGQPTLATLPNRQLFDLEGLRGRALSSSYIPGPGHPKHEPMLAALQALFDAYQREGHVAFDYDTKIYYGQLDP